MNSISVNTTIQELIEIEKISQRVLHVCAYNGLNTISDLIEHYREYGTFIKLRNCGQKSNVELTRIYFNYCMLLPDPELVSVKEKPELFDLFDSLKTQQKVILNNILSSRIKTLQIRAFNALQKFLGNNFTFANYYKLIISSKDFNFNKIRNVGAGTTIELEKINNEIIDYFKLISTIKTEKELNQEYLYSLLDSHFNISSIHKRQINLESNSEKIQIFRIIKLLIDNDYIFDNKRTVIFKNLFNYFEHNNEMNLEEIGVIIDLSRERVRQIRNEIFTDLPNAFSFIMNFDFSHLNLYETDNSEDILLISDNLLNEIVFTEGIDFNKLFINKILSILLSNLYSLIGNEEDLVFCNVNRNSHNWISTYLIKNKFTSIFDFVKFIEETSRRLKEKNSEDYTLYFKSYLSDFFTNYDLKQLDRISEICEIILLAELSLIIDQEDCIHFKRKTTKKLTNYIIEILEEKQKPLSLDEIFKVLNARYPGICKSPDALRVHCNRNYSTKLIYFGRSSIYGLKEWETKYENIRGGTIRDLAESYLQQFNEPKHITSIFKYIKKFRKTNLKSISTNLKLEANRFVFFGKGYVGLVGIKYDLDNFQLIIQRSNN
jgi:hypothetical protein